MPGDVRVDIGVHRGGCVCVVRERSLVFTQLPVSVAVPGVVWAHSVHKHRLQNGKKSAGKSPNYTCVDDLGVEVIIAPFQVKYVCDSLGMRFTEELNSHNCSFVICSTSSDASGSAALPVTGDKMVQVMTR